MPNPTKIESALNLGNPTMTDIQVQQMDVMYLSLWRQLSQDSRYSLISEIIMADIQILEGTARTHHLGYQRGTVHTGEQIVAYIQNY